MQLIESKKKKAVMYTVGVLGIVMIALGLAPMPNVMLPPLVTGIGFLALAWGMRA